MARPGATAARRYAEALYALATRDRTLDEYAAGLELAATTLGGEAVLDVLRNPARPLPKRTELVEKALADRAPAAVVRLVALLVQRRRIDRLPDVAVEYRRLLNRERGVVEALATTTTPLSSEDTEKLRDKLATMTGRTVDLTVAVDESLLGGLTVRVGDTLYDASVRGRLERLRERLLAGAR
jgi:F-type H+-transporting ATPase subunit delta